MSPTQHSLKILLADDSPEIRVILVRLLTRMGHTVVAEEDGHAAVQRFEQQDFDLVLLDGIMPKMDGYEATRHIKIMAEQRKLWVPIILISAASDQDSLVRGLEAGAEDFLPKPLHPRVLNVKIDAYARSLSAYRRLIESEEQARAVSEGVVDAIITIDERGIVLSCNRATTQIFGYEREELIGNNVSKLMPKELQVKHDGYLQRYLTTGEAHVIGSTGREVKGQCKDGQLIDLRLGVSEIRLTKGERWFIGVLSDITPQKQQEARLRENATKLQRFNAEMMEDMDIANAVMNRLIYRSGLTDAQLRHYLSPSAQFSGDAIAAVRSAANDILYLMVADATGHGLAAAISLLPALWVFYAMARQGRTVQEIVAEINTRLKEAIPVGRFVAAHVASINNPARTVRLWSGGMPPAYWIDESTGEIRELRSKHVALGILPTEMFRPYAEIIEWQTPGQMFFTSDGLIEATDEDGSMFGADRLKQLLLNHSGEARLESVVDNIKAYLGERPPQDDIALLSVTLPA